MSETTAYPFHEVTRVEVIDEGGRTYYNLNAGMVEVHLQDDGKTLKVFTRGCMH
jgi:hypothetical protein